MPRKLNSLDDDKKVKNLNLDPQCRNPPNDAIRDLGVLLGCRLNMTQHNYLLHCQNTLFPPPQNSTSETLSCQNIASYSCFSSRHLPTRSLQLCLLLSLFIHATPLNSVLHTATRLIKDLGSRDHITPTLKQLH